MGESTQHKPLQSVVISLTTRTKIIVEDIRRVTRKRGPAVDEVRLTMIVGGDLGGVLAHLDRTHRRELIAALQAFDGDVTEAAMIACLTRDEIIGNLASDAGRTPEYIAEVALNALRKIT